MQRAASRNVSVSWIADWLEAAVTAAGNSQGTSTALNAANARHLVTVGALGAGVKLPAATGSGQSHTIYNQIDYGTYAYPRSGESIYPLSANAAALVGARLATTFTDVSSGLWVSDETTLTANPPLFWEDDGSLSVDSNAVGTDLFGSAPSQGSLATGLAFKPATLGDWNAGVWTYSGSYQIVGDIFSFVFNVSGTPSFSTSSGNLQITGWPVTFATGACSAMYQVTGFTTWDANTIGAYVRLITSTGTLAINRKSASPANIAVSALTSGTAVSFTVAGAAMIA